MRVQVEMDGRLQLEVVLEDHMLGSTFTPGGHFTARLARAKHRAGKPVGGTVVRRADLPRVWDVRVGELIAPGRRWVVEMQVGDRWVPCATGLRQQRLLVFADEGHARGWVGLLNVRVHLHSAFRAGRRG